MCDAACKDFASWCKSFTRTEALLTTLEAAFLVFLIALMTFVVGHLIVCSDNSYQYEIPSTPSPTMPTDSSTKAQASKEPDSTGNYETPLLQSECTWHPSTKTVAKAHYYFKSTTNVKLKYPDHNTTTEKRNEELVSQMIKTEPGETRADAYKKSILALVKIKPQNSITFGCILTIVSYKWTLTAASCIESIEEVDNLDSFVMMENYEENHENAVYSLSDIQIHPLYQGSNHSYDLAALKSEKRFNTESFIPLNVPSMVDHFLISIGEKYSVLGFGKHRTVNKHESSRSLNQGGVYIVPVRQCLSGSAWSLRHLSRGAAVRHAACGAGPLCARGDPPGACHYCAGAPLVLGRTLLALMSDNPHCGISCEPALYVNLAAANDWLQATLV